MIDLVVARSGRPVCPRTPCATVRMTLALARVPADHQAMHERERSASEDAGAGHRVRRALAPEPPLLLLQRTAGNAAVSRLVAGLAVQRYLPDAPEPTPEEEWEQALPDPTAPVMWLAQVGPGILQVYPVPMAPGAMVESSRVVVMEWARSLPEEEIPSGYTQGGGSPVQANAKMVQMPPPDEWSRQIFRAWAGVPTPAIERLVGRPGGGGPGAPGGGAGPGPGPAPGGGPGAIPGMEPVAPGGGEPAGIPGMEPVPPGGGAAGPGGIPGMEPVPPGGSGAPGPGRIPGIEPVSPGTGAGPAGARPIIRLGSIGDAVREAQGLLVRHGATLTPDGQFGPATQQAAVEFQRSAGLSPDGIVGPLTWRALESA